MAAWRVWRQQSFTDAQLELRKNEKKPMFVGEQTTAPQPQTSSRERGRRSAARGAGTPWRAPMRESTLGTARGVPRIATSWRWLRRQKLPHAFALPHASASKHRLADTTAHTT
eukprot:6178146-Pleurochrysis_carterae.AAC.2